MRILVVEDERKLAQAVTRPEGGALRSCPGADRWGWLFSGECGELRSGALGPHAARPQRPRDPADAPQAPGPNASLDPDRTWLEFTVEAIFLPFDRDGTPELEFETNFVWLLSERTRGWVGSHFDVVDKFGSAERPTDRRAYTHKLNLELDTSVSITRGTRMSLPSSFVSR